MGGEIWEEGEEQRGKSTSVASHTASQGQSKIESQIYRRKGKGPLKGRQARNKAT